VLALAGACDCYQLYDHLVRRLAETDAGADALLRFAVHRAVAGACTAVSTELAARYLHGIPEVEWAARRGQEHALAAFHLLELP
jgi:hypothetical protein